MSLERTTNRATQIISLLALISLLPLAAAFPVYADGAWTKKSPLCVACPSARYGHAMAWLGGDKVLLFGGRDETNSHYGDTYVYDLSENSWVGIWPAGAPSARSGHAMAPLGGDQVLLSGGFDGARDGETWVYDLSENSWTNMAPAAAPSARSGHAMAWLGGDQVLLFGGFDETHDDETWVYDLSENSWTNQSPAAAPFATYNHAMAWLGGDQALLYGGCFETPGGQTWVYDLSENSWTNQSPAGAPSALHGHAMAWLGGDQVLLFGGDGRFGPFHDETWVYDLSENSWTNQSPAGAPSHRGYHAMAWAGGDQVLLFGGMGGVYPYDWTVDDETWVATGFFTPARTYLPLVMRNY